MIVKCEYTFHDLYDNSWSGAINTLNTIIENDKEDELMDFLEQIFDEVTDVQLNDFLWFDSDYIFEHLGIENED